MTRARFYRYQQENVPSPSLIELQCQLIRRERPQPEKWTADEDRFLPDVTSLLSTAMLDVAMIDLKWLIHHFEKYEKRGWKIELAATAGRFLEAVHSLVWLSDKSAADRDVDGLTIEDVIAYDGLNPNLFRKNAVDAVEALPAKFFQWVLQVFDDATRLTADSDSDQLGAEESDPIDELDAEHSGRGVLVGASE